jgi:hypothetical protein
MTLRPNEFCPIHRSTSCCGRELMIRPRLIRLGVQRIEDPHHPRGYRELRSPAEMRKLLNRKIVQQGGICAICHEDFTDYNDVVPDHRDPKGMGGAWRDDHPDNIEPANPDFAPAVPFVTAFSGVVGAGETLKQPQEIFSLLALAQVLRANCVRGSTKTRTSDPIVAS